MAIKNVTIVGGGVMGAGIAEASTIILLSYIFKLYEVNKGCLTALRI